MMNERNSIWKAMENNKTSFWSFGGSSIVILMTDIIYFY